MRAASRNASDIMIAACDVRAPAKSLLATWSRALYKSNMPC